MTNPTPVDDEVAGGERARVDSTPLMIWAGIAAVSVVVRTLASPGGIALDRWDSLSQWASSAYLDVADHGYRAGGVFVMPGYAVLVRALTWVTGGRLTTAVLVSYAASAAASWLFWLWLEGRGIDRRTRVWSLLALLLFPYSFILMGVVSADGLVLALVLGAFLLLDRDQPWLAGVVAAVAILTQVTALAIVPALLIMAWSSRPAPARSGKLGVLGAAGLAVLGPIGLSVYLGIANSDAGRPWRGDGALGGIVSGVFHPGTWIRLTFLAEDTPLSWKFHRGAEALCMIAVVVAAYWVAKRFGAAYGVFVVGVSVMTLIGFTDTSSSGPRLTLAFPVAALAGAFLAKRSPILAGAVLALSGGLMVWFYVLFVRSVGVPFW